MEFYKNWLVGLDMTDTDGYLMNNLVRLAGIFKPEKITFLHVAHPPELPREVMQEIPDLQVPELLFYEQRIENMIQDSGLNADTGIIVREGHPLTTILQVIDEHDFDLIVVGKKGNEGKVERKIARKSGISVLFVPEKDLELKHVTVPVDFSEHAELALDVASRLSDKVEEVSCLHVYRDSSKYISQVVETVDDVQNMLAKRSILDQKLAAYADHKLKETLKGHGNFNPTVHLEGINKSLDIGEFIVEWVKTHPAEMVIIGARGKTAAAAALLGAVSETVYTGISDRFLLVIKRPGENVGLIRALLGK